MKKQITELIVLITLMSVIYIKDMFLYYNSQIKIIETSLNFDLKTKLDDYTKINNENNLKNINEYKCITRIKTHQINSFYNEISIINNQNCHLKKGDIVLNEGGLLGIVSKVIKKVAYVKLITNSDIKLSAKINDNYGTLYAENGKIYLTDMVKDMDINDNGLVYTSGLTEIPKNILIGKAVKVFKKNNRVIVEVKPASNIYDNPYVSIFGDIK